MKTKVEIIYTVESSDPITRELISSVKEHDLDRFKAIVDSNPQLLQNRNIFTFKEKINSLEFSTQASYEHLLAIYGFSEGISYIIVHKKYAGWNCGARSGSTPLMFTAQNGHTDTAKILIAEGADINRANNSGYTPLILAAQNGHTDTAKLLIAAGADVNKADEEHGNTPLTVATMNGHTEITKILTAAGANVNKADKIGNTPLILTTDKGYIDTAKILIAAGADVNKANKYGNTPLIIAAWKGHTKISEPLIAAGADVNKANKNGNTPLILAARYGHIETAKLLIAAGACKLTNKMDFSQPMLHILKAQEYIDDLLEGKKPAAIDLDATEEEMVLARVENGLSKLLKPGKIALNINSIKATFEGYKKDHPIAGKVLAKIEEFVEYNVLDKDAEVARSFGLSFPESLKDIMAFLSHYGDKTYELSETLLKAYDKHKDEPSVIERLNRLKASFESYLSYKKSYLAEHPKHNPSDIPMDIKPKLNLLFSNLLQLEGMNDYQSEFDNTPLLEEAILFYSLNPKYQLPGNLTDITQCENSFNLPYSCNIL